MSTEAREIIRWQILAFVPADTVNEEEMADAVLAALREAGLEIVSREPTEIIVHYIAGALDYPSVYMGGPSANSRRRAERAYKAMISSSEDPTICDRCGATRASYAERCDAPLEEQPCPGSIAIDIALNAPK